MTVWDFNHLFAGYLLVIWWPIKTVKKFIIMTPNLERSPWSNFAPRYIFSKHTVCDIIHSLNGMLLSRSSLVVLTNSILWNDRSMLLMTIRSKLPVLTHTKLSLTTVISGNKLKLGLKRVGHLNQSNRFWNRYLYVRFVLTVLRVGLSTSTLHTTVVLSFDHMFTRKHVLNDNLFRKSWFW